MRALRSGRPRRAGRIPARSVILLTLAGLVVPASSPRPASAQEGSAREAGTAVERRLAEIISKEVAVGRDEATLRLELVDGAETEIRFHDGRVHIDGEDVGPFGRELEGAWRELLGRAVALDDRPLARTLVGWERPAALEGEASAVWDRIDRALDDALERELVADAGAAGSGGTVALGRLLGRTERLAELAVAMDGLDVDDVRIHVGEDVVVEDGERVDATLLVIDGDVEIQGEVAEHLVVVGGSVRTFDGSRIGGDVRLSDARLVRDGGTISGIVREGSGREAEIEERIQDARRRAEAAEERAREAAERAEARMERRAEADDGGLLAPFRSVARSITRSIAGLVQTFVYLVVLSVLGGLAVLFGRRNLEVVAETARRSPGRAAAVGLAGTFLTLPVWILGTVALVVTIVGIPVAIAWLPLFPAAVVLAIVFGYFAVAHNAGEWLARRRYPYLGWVRSSNPYTLVAGGVVGLLAAFFLAHAVTLFGPWLQFLKGMLIATGLMVSVGAAMVGFGAVLLTRAGRRPEYYGPTSDPFDDPWNWDPTPPPPPPGPAGTGGAPGGSRGPAATESGESRGGKTDRAGEGSFGTDGGAGTAGKGSGE